MENLTLISSPRISLVSTANLNGVISIRHSSLFHLSKRPPIKTRSIRVSAHVNQGNGEARRVLSRNGMEAFASISSSSSRETSSSVGVSPPLSYPPPPSQMGSHLFWIGGSWALCAFYCGDNKFKGELPSMLLSLYKKYAMQQAMKTMMGQMAAGNNQGSSAFSAGSPFPFPPIQTTSTLGAPPFVASQPGVTVDVSATKVETAPPSNVKDNTEAKRETKKYAFVDVPPEELVQTDRYESFKELVNTSTTGNAQFTEASQNGATAKQDKGAYNETSQSSRKPGAPLSVEALEKMMEDPTVQKMVYPHLPEEMRNPDSFKWMLQNPQYRKQMEDMLNSMGGNNEWDNKMMDSLKFFDLSSPEVRQQFGEFENLIRRFERPDRRNRWDCPLFELWPSKDGIKQSSAAIEDDVSYLTKKPDSKTRDVKILQPTIATQNARVSEANSLYEMDRATQEVISAIVEAQSQALGGLVNGISLGQHLPTINIQTPVGLPQLRSLRRTFIKLTAQSSLSGPAPPSDADSAKRMFVDYLNREFGAV